MTKIISVEYPEYLANSLRMSESDFETEMKVSALVKLFELGKVSSGTAAKVLGISRSDFLDLLGKYKVTFFNSDDLKEDLKNA